MTMLPKGKYRARATGNTELGESPEKKTPQVAVEFAILDEAHAGELITWMGYFTEGSTERTMESLRHCGWSSDDVSDLTGIDANEVQLVVDHETYEGTTRAKVQWVNKSGTGVVMKSPMSADQKKAFAAQMRGAAVKSRSAKKGDGFDMF